MASEPGFVLPAWTSLANRPNFCLVFLHEDLAVSALHTNYNRATHPRMFAHPPPSTCNYSTTLAVNSYAAIEARMNEACDVIYDSWYINCV